MNIKKNREDLYGPELSAECARALAAFPEALQKLVAEELKDGNAIGSIEHGFPAAPCGASIKLARQVSDERRMSTAEVDFYARNNAWYSGEFTTHQRHFFVLEPPMPSTPAPDMDAIREKLSASQRAADAIRIEMQQPKFCAIRSEVVDRFRESLAIDYDRWREGIGYDLSLLHTANTEERAAIERILLHRTINDWRDVEALAALRTPLAFEKLRNALTHQDHAVVMAILVHAPQLVSLEERTRILIAMLKSGDFYHGLSQALQEIEQYHPPVIIDTLLDCLLDREDGVLAHFASMLMYLHGKADVPFDWEKRPLYLRFNTPDRLKREMAFRELCEAIGIDANMYLNARK